MLYVCVCVWVGALDVPSGLSSPYGGPKHSRETSLCVWYDTGLGQRGQCVAVALRLLFHSVLVSVASPPCSRIVSVVSCPSIIVIPVMGDKVRNE